VSVRIASAAPTLLSKPSATLLLGNSGTFTWTSVPGLTYQYSLDGGGWTNTASSSSQKVTLSVLGSHSFRLRGTDTLGNHTAITAYSVTVIL